MRGIALLVSLFSMVAANASQAFNAKAYFEDAITKTKQPAHHFIELYLHQHDFDNAHQLLCRDIADKTPVSSLKTVYSQLEEFADLSQFSEIKIVDAYVQLTKVEPEGLVNYVVVLTHNNDEKISGSITLRATSGCLWGWRFEPMKIKQFQFDN
ncbi:hypothetical protein OPS25_11530 [Alteromonas ponticola]|uniref:DUF3887 domain-containing protein n=1 Tax=Alteromonas aquimaris TaxID=2998417 RepID=A0ABT3P8P4_9ALTE|nr:hypothetical protein [Alteromonas aquimaris]MCW8109128.1 hypothetical protein [Alteromonas aquimaris]